MAFRRPRPPARERIARAALAGAATRIDLTKLPKAFDTRRQGIGGAGWQHQVWDYFDAVPEVQFATTYVGQTTSKVRLYAATFPEGAPLDADPLPVTDPDSGIPADIALAAQAKVESVRSLGGQAELVQLWFENTELVGEVHMVHWAPRPLPGDPPDTEPTLETWEIHSRDELVALDDLTAPGGKSLYVKSTPEQSKAEDMRRVVPDVDEVIRCWRRHPRWSGWAHSPFKSCLGELGIVQVLSGQIMAQAMSRHNAGIVFLPSEADVMSPAPNEPDDDEAPASPSLAVAIGQAFVEPISDPSSPLSVVPTLVKMPGDLLGKPTWMVDPRQHDDVEGQIAQHLTRLAHGINLPPEVLEGHMQTTFANAGQIDEDTFDDYLEPRVMFLAQAWTFSILVPDLVAAFPDRADLCRRIFVWYDAAPLISTVDPATNVMDAWDRGLLSDEAGRKHLGYDESDAPDDLERLTRLAFNGVARPTPEVLDALYDLVGIHVAPIEPAGAAPAPPPAENPSTTPPDATTVEAAMRYLRRNPVMVDRLIALRDAQGRIRPSGAPIPARLAPTRAITAGRRPRPLGQRLLAIDQEVRARLLASSSMAMDRAIERAQNKARNARIPRGITASAPTIEADAWSGLRDKFMAWGGAAQDDALDLASRAVSGLATAERAAIKARQAGDLDTAWSWFEHALTVLANATLINPSSITDLAAEGEQDIDLRVPPGIVRSALAQAGGATGLRITEGRGVFLPLSNAGRTPAGGIATGETISNTLAENGVARDGYAWVYGPARRTHPFEPHADLDGVTFENFDDDVLANTEGWPEFDYYLPGDHDGCVCDYEPILLANDGSPL